MPKKSAHNAQRNKARAQKSFELVRPTNSDLVEPVVETSTTTEEPTPVSVSATASSEKQATILPPPTQKSSEKQATILPPPTQKSSASARLAARRQNTQRQSQRSAAAIITPEHYTYVRRDLLTIAILAVIMLAALLILYFTIGRGF